jgi:hypothetical protein
MKKLPSKTPLRSLTVELTKVKGGTDPNTGPVEPPPTTDARAHIIDVG